MEDLIYQAASVAVSGAIGYGVLRFKMMTGITIEKGHREALHEALMSGAVAAYQEGPAEAVEVIRDKAIEHARLSVPDALAFIKPHSQVLRGIAMRKVNEAAPFDLPQSLLEGGQ